MPSILTIPRRFHTGYSLLGKAVRKRIGDRLYAEGMYILILAAILICAVLAFYLGWALLQPVIQTEQDAFIFACAQAFVAMFIFMTCIWGYKPALQIEYSSEALVIKHGDLARRISAGSVRSCSPLSALDYHRHFRKYGQTLFFSNRSSDHLMLIRTDDGPVVLGLPEQNWEAVRHLLERSGSHKPSVETSILAA